MTTKTTKSNKPVDHETAFVRALTSVSKAKQAVHKLLLDAVEQCSADNQNWLKTDLYLLMTHKESGPDCQAVVKWLSLIGIRVSGKGATCANEMKLTIIEGWEAKNIKAAVTPEAMDTLRSTPYWQTIKGKTAFKPPLPNAERIGLDAAKAALCDETFDLESLLASIKANFTAKQPEARKWATEHEAEIASLKS